MGQYGHKFDSFIENNILETVNLELSNINLYTSDLDIEIVQESGVKNFFKAVINKVIKFFESVKKFIANTVSAIFLKLKKLIKNLEDNHIKERFKKFLSKVKSSKSTNESAIISETTQGDLVKITNEEIPYDVIELSKYEIERIDKFLSGEFVEFAKKYFAKYKNAERYSNADEYFDMLEQEGYIKKMKMTNVQFVEWYINNDPAKNTYKYTEADFNTFNSKTDQKIKKLQDALKELENSTEEVPSKLKSLDDIIKFSGDSTEMNKELEILKYCQSQGQFMFSAYLKCMKEFYQVLKYVDQRMSKVGFRIDEVEFNNKEDED